MFTNPLIDYAVVTDRLNEQRENQLHAMFQARHLYQKLHWRAWLHQVWLALTGQHVYLASLSELVPAGALRVQHPLGLRTVPLSQIRGSEGRVSDFDAVFRPITSHTEDRWLSVAGAMLQGLSLPPVELIQVGNQFFVRDGHHRVSVARASGQTEIEALVTAWDLAEPFCAEESCVPLPNPAL